jgi:hypothetical protein
MADGVSLQIYELAARSSAREVADVGQEENDLSPKMSLARDVEVGVCHCKKNSFFHTKLD